MPPAASPVTLATWPACPRAYSPSTSTSTRRSLPPGMCGLRVYEAHPTGLRPHAAAASRCPPDISSVCLCSGKSVTDPNYLGARVTVPAAAAKWPTMLFFVSDEEPPAFTFTPGECLASAAARTCCYAPCAGVAVQAQGSLRAAPRQASIRAAAARVQDSLPPCLCTAQGTTSTGTAGWPRTRRASAPCSLLRWRWLIRARPSTCPAGPEVGRAGAAVPRAAPAVPAEGAKLEADVHVRLRSLSPAARQPAVGPCVLGTAARIVPAGRVQASACPPLAAPAADAGDGSLFSSDAFYMVGFAIDPAGTQDVPRWGGVSWVVGTEDEFCAQSPLPDECNPDPSPPPSPPNPPPRPPPPPPPGEADR